MRFAMEEMPLVQTQIQNQTMSQNVTKEPKYVVQLNKFETDPYLLQNFQCMTMFISAFCKICELNTEGEIVFALILKVISYRCNFRFTNGFAILTKYRHNQTNGRITLENLKKIRICFVFI